MVCPPQWVCLALSPSFPSPCHPYTTLHHVEPSTGDGLFLAIPSCMFRYRDSINGCACYARRLVWARWNGTRVKTRDIRPRHYKVLLGIEAFHLIALQQCC